MSNINPLTNHFKVTIVADAQEAIECGFNWSAQQDVKPIEVEQLVIVRDGTVSNKPTVDFVLKDATGQRYVFMMTGALLSSLPTFSPE